MGKYVVSVATSVDGFYESSGQSVEQMPMDDGFGTHNLELLRRSSTLVYGSRWFGDNWAYWSAVADDPEAGEEQRETAALVTSMDGVVISDSMTIDADDPWAASTRVVPRADAPAEVARLKEADGDLLSFGSSTTWNPLFQQGLVDELRVLVGPALLGDGSALYSGPRAGLRLLDAQVLPGSEMVVLRYDATGATG